MLSRTLFTATLLALTSFTIATPPGCLLGAVNSYDDPANVKSICSEKDVAKTVSKFCGDSTRQALEALADVCNGAGVKISTDVPKSTASASGSKASATPSGSIIVPSRNAIVPSATGSPSMPSGTGAAGGAGGASATSSSRVAQSTGAAGRLEVGIVAALAGFLAIAW
ncbi:hypothetical protein GQ44DRAFT_607484 [Phaeosphaeriaceae sp. PMI808]|nr:hypothetical protein GQ44DRAFT_607484 [Phaeosphaeriaceae sp. PMI808]